MPSRKKPPSPSKFAVGDAVRVKPGVAVSDFPDLPLSGWCGAVKKVEAGHSPTYLVKWDNRTLQNIHPVFRKRCEKGGFEFEEMWLAEDDLERDTGQSVTQIITKPLSPNEQDDRLRMIFSLTSNDPVPDVSEETLLKYHEHLANSLSVPFDAEYSEESAPLRDTTHAITVVGLLDPNEYPLDEDYGLFCTARQGRRMVQLPLSEVEVAEGQPNHQPLDDYSYWFRNWG